MKTTLEHLQKASDAALVRLFQRGSNRAFDVLFHRYYRKLRSYAHRLLGNKAIEEDVVQNAMTDAYFKLRKKLYNEDGHFYSWLRSIVHHKAIDLLRSDTHAAARVKVPLLLIEDIITEDTREFSYGELTEKMQWAMAHLSQRYRDIVRKHVLEDMSFNNIAAEMHTTPGSARSAFSKAIKLLRRLLKKP